MYATLTAALVLATLGVYVSAATGFGQGLGILGFMVCVPWMLATPATPDNLRKRRGLFAGAALSQVRPGGSWGRLGSPLAGLPRARPHSWPVVALLACPHDAHTHCCRMRRAC